MKAENVVVNAHIKNIVSDVMGGHMLKPEHHLVVAKAY